MTRLAALLACCLCFATITMASNQDQWTGTTRLERAKVTLPKASYLDALEAEVEKAILAEQGDPRSKVMQAPKLRPKGD